MADGRPSSSKSRSRFPGLLISNLVFTDARLGRGADAAVYAVEWNGTVCAAKRLHDILLEDESPGGTDKLISNFETECLTWSKLRHPGVVQFMGVYLERSSRLPVLVMEKMDTSLRTYLEERSKEEFPLHLKATVLHQVAQALAYLHNQDPPLVHHDLSTNNVLLNVVSFVAKISDFGMSRAINPSTLSRKSSILGGTPAFMAPEALQNPPQYNEKLDVFSFGNIIISTVTHDWPDPGLPNRYEGDQLVALNELQRREHYIAKFPVHEKQVFLPTVNHCLENRPDKRPSSAVLVQALSRIKSSLLRSDRVAMPVAQLHQQLSAREEECRQKDEALKVKDEALGVKDEALREKERLLKKTEEECLQKDEALKVKNEALRVADEALKVKDEALRVKDEALRRNARLLRETEEECLQKDATIQAQDAEIQRLKDQLALTVPAQVS